MKPWQTCAAWICLYLLGSGCASQSLRSQSPEDAETAASKTRLISDLAGPFGLSPLRVESIGLVMQLDGTGSNPVPSLERSAILEEMEKRGVINPNQWLASKTTSVVWVRGWIRPGIQKGDRFDVELRVPSRSETTSLRGGFLIETRLQELGVENALMGNRLHEGKLLALAQGPVLVDPAAKEGTIKINRGRVLGGAVALESRDLGLVLRNDYQNVVVSADMGNAINHRFHSYYHGIQKGMANPKSDKYVTLQLHPRYKDNLERYLKVILAIAVRETAGEQSKRLHLLERQLLDPITAGTAAVRLEAIGNAGIPVLKKGLESTNSEVRFYAAEALAYLDEDAAAAPLAQAALEEPAFRAYALAALSAMDDFSASEALRELLHVPSAETRYGAFRSLWAMNSRDALVAGENLNGKFSYHIIPTHGPELIHATRSFRGELVLFGGEQRIATPLVVEAGKKIMINAHDSDRVVVSRFSVNEPDQKREVSTRVDEIVRAIVDVGGNYPDVVQFLQEAKSKGALASRFEIDALPKGGRGYDREEGGEEKEGAPFLVSSPLSNLFFTRSSNRETSSSLAPKPPVEGVVVKNPEEKTHPVQGFFGKLSGK